MSRVINTAREHQPDKHIQTLLALTSFHQKLEPKTAQRQNTTANLTMLQKNNKKITEKLHSDTWEIQIETQH